MNLPPGLNLRECKPVPLAGLTWFGLGGPAQRMFRPGTLDELVQVLEHCREARLPFRILGSGANVLVSDDGFDGAVIQLSDPEFTQIRLEGHVVFAGGAVDLPLLIRRTTGNGLAGLEVLGGIPGTVGGTIRMNAGGRFGEISNSVRRVRVVSADGNVEWLARQDVGFAYRHTDLGGRIVVEVEFDLQPEDPATIRKRLLEVWAYKKASQPLADHSAGCIFRNPPGDSAGRLIEQAGLKGLRCGRARVSDQHGNFIIADQGAAAADVIELIGRVRRAVFERYEVKLELEIDVWEPVRGLATRRSDA